VASSRPISVLILDDESGIRRSIADYLTDEGRFETREAATAAEALSILEGGGVQVCLVDLRLGGTDGFAFLEQAQPRHPGVQFFIQTGSYEADVRERAQAVGIGEERVFLKPFRLELLVQAIDRALGG
jgi:two-component system NtrC family response regulator